MDPDAVLTAIREAIEEGEELDVAIQFGYLDEWLSRGGFLPKDWATVSRPSARVYWDATKQEGD